VNFLYEFQNKKLESITRRILYSVNKRTLVVLKNFLETCIFTFSILLNYFMLCFVVNII